MTLDELDSLLAEQVAYYRARAPEYDATTHSTMRRAQGSSMR